MADPLLDDLNAHQRRGVTTTEGPVLLLAGAGSGKTRVVTRRIAYLIRERLCEPDQVLAVTFTNKAAAEMQERVAHLLPGTRVPWVMTFHGLCVRILRQSGHLVGLDPMWQIVDADDARGLLREVLSDLAQEDDEVDARKVRETMRRISGFKNTGLTIADVGNPFVARVWAGYQDALAEVGGLDFDDLLVRANEVLATADGQRVWGRRFAYLHVDEGQDANTPQEKLVKALGSHTGNVCMVGDEQQCQPGDCRVLTVDGPRGMSSLSPDDDRLVGCDERHGRTTGGHPFSIAARPYAGPLHELATSTTSTRCTPAHRWPTRWGPEAADAHVVSLVRRGDRWRIGHARLLDETGRPLCLDAQDDGLWILEVLPDHGTCLARGRDVSVRYGIPYEDAPGDDPPAERRRRAVACLRAYGREPDHPFLRATPMVVPRSGGMHVAACNLIPELMLLAEHAPGPGDGMLSWQPFTCRVEPYEGLVYSLDVVPHHTYFVDGLLSCNSIYSFRHASIDHILGFKTRWPGTQVIKLEDNYRSTPEIVAAANAVIRPARVKVVDKILRATRGTGEAVRLMRCANPWEEAELMAREVGRGGIRPEDVAVIYRQNSQSRPFEEVLTRHGLPYHVVGGVAFLSRAEVKTARSYLQLLIAPNDAISFKRVVENPRRGLGPAAQERIRAYAREGGLHLLAALVHGGRGRIDGLNARAVAGCAHLGDMYKRLLSEPHDDLQAVGTALLARSGYLDALRKAKDEDALGNLSEFVSLLGGYAREDGEWVTALREFAEYAALGDTSAQEREGVALMTIHATKGLEFPHVYLVGLEDELFVRADTPEAEIEEARRLLYVAMTRAEERLVMSLSRERQQWGQTTTTRPLRFLSDLPATVARHDVRPRERGRPSRRGVGGSSPGRAQAPSRHATGRTRGGPDGRHGGQRSTGRGGAPSAGTSQVPQRQARPSRPVAGRIVPVGVGQVVAHERFGRGRVTAVTDQRVTIAFDDRTRQLDRAYAKISVIG